MSFGVYAAGGGARRRRLLMLAGRDVDAIRSKGLFCRNGKRLRKYYPIPAMLADESREFELVIRLFYQSHAVGYVQRIKPLLPVREGRDDFILTAREISRTTGEAMIDRQRKSMRV